MTRRWASWLSYGAVLGVNAIGALPTSSEAGQNPRGLEARFRAGPALIRGSVIHSEADILHHDKQYEPFYSSFVALSAHYITTVCGQSKYPPHL